MGLAVLAAAAGLGCWASLAFGTKTLPAGAVWHALISPTGSVSDIVVLDLRLPRTVLGILAGAGLGVAGALMQGHTRNPLADPGLLGVEQGAALGVVIAISALGLTSLTSYVWFGCVGALIAAVVVYLIGTAGRGPTPVTLALAGTAVSWLLYAVVSALVLTDRQALEEFRFWRIGALAGRDMSIALQAAPFVAIGLMVAFAGAASLNALALGEDVARSLGQRVTVARATGAAAVTLTTGAVVAACGPIAFVGLVVPHIARYLAGVDYRWLLPYAGLLGVLLLLVADVAGRLVARPGEIEVSLMLALLGAPFFIALVRRKRLVRL